jgi:hypothetical protein
MRREAGMELNGRRRGWLLAAAVGGSALAVLLYSSSGQDDAHITLWSAWSLAEKGAILNHSGERVEQSSSLLHTLVLAAAYRTTGVHLAWLAWGLGIAAAVATVLRLARLARELGFELGPLGAAVCATMPAFAYWQLGLLESSLFSWCAVEFLLHLARIVRGARGRGAWLALALWTAAFAAVRPEAPLLACAVPALLVGLAFARCPASNARRALAGALFLALAATAGLVLLRLALFGRAFPNPVAAKFDAGGDLAAALGRGLDYLLDRLRSPSGALLPLALVGALLALARDARSGDLHRVGPALLVLLYLGFAVAVGGDWMFGWRFVAHVEPLFGLFLVGLLARATSRPRRVLLGIALAANVAGMVLLGARVGTGRPLWSAWQIDPAVRAFAGEGSAWPERANQVHSRDLVAADDLGRVLDALLAVEERLTVLSQQAGLVLFYVARERPGRLEFVDRMGLASAHFERVRRELGLPTGPMGIQWSAEEWVELAREREEPAFHPDVVFDLDPDFARLLSARGYVVVYEQVGITSGTWASAEEARLAAAGEPQAPWRALTDDELGRDTADDDANAATAVELPFWRSQTRMFEFVAVREELARAAGLADVDLALELLGEGVHASRQTLVWNLAQLPHLRFFRGEAPELSAAQDPLRGVVAFSGTGTAEVDGRQAWRPVGAVDGELLRVTGASVESPGAEPRALAFGRELAVQGQDTAEVELRLRPEALVRRGDRVRIRGWTLGRAPRSLDWAPAARSE